MHDYKYSRIVLPFIDQGKPIFSLIAARPVNPEDPDQPLKPHGKVIIYPFPAQWRYGVLGIFES